MPLESATYVNQLDNTNPAATDALSQGDDHIRLIKGALKNTFPNVSGAVTVSHTDLNKIPTLETNLGTTQAGKVNKAGDSMSGTLTITSGDLEVTSGTIKVAGGPLLPRGLIAMWSGHAGGIPDGWALCNGTVVNGLQTPDLRGRFIAGAGAGGMVMQQTGGNTQISATTSPAGSHSHTGGTDAAGGHDHGGGTAGHALAVEQLPPHVHTVTHGSMAGGGSPTLSGGSAGTHGTWSQTDVTGAGHPHNHGIGISGVHAHAIGTTTVGNHTHSITADYTPPYYALAFIIKL